MAYENKQNRRNKSRGNIQNKSLGGTGAVKNQKTGRNRVNPKVSRYSMRDMTPTITEGGKIIRAVEADKTNPNYREFWKDENVDEYMEAVFTRISDLLLGNIELLQPFLDNGIRSVQKTFRDGEIISERNEDETQIIYESNIDASFIERDYKRMILNHLDFTHPDYISMRVVDDTGQDGDLVKSFPNIYLLAPSRGSLNIDKLIGSSHSKYSLKKMIGLNASQFLNIDTNKININRHSLSEHVDIKFSEIIPNTLGTKLNEFETQKEGIPFYSYRTEDFFKEYSININPEIPMEYRIQKFFEQYEEIKDSIPGGTIPPNEMEKASSTYLIQETAKNLSDDNEIPAYTAKQLQELLDENQELKEKVEELHMATGSAATELQEMQDKMYDFDEDDE